MAKALLVSGFHRSGTSMTANLLQNAGLDLGEKLLPAGESNPYGHFEDAQVVHFHDRLLRNRGLNWQADRPFLAHLTGSQWDWMARFVTQRERLPLWGFKDPRLCLFLLPWKRVLPRAKVLYVHRPAEECIHSLKLRAVREMSNERPGAEVHARFWQQPDLAARTYLCYASMFLKVARHYPGDVAFVSRQAIIDGYDLPDALNALWDLGLAGADIQDVYDPGVTDNASGYTFVSDAGLLEAIQRVTETIEKRLLENMS